MKSSGENRIEPMEDSQSKLNGKDLHNAREFDPVIKVTNITGRSLQFSGPELPASQNGFEIPAQTNGEYDGLTQGRIPAMKSGNILNIRRLDKRLPDCTDEENYQILWISGGIGSITIDFETLPFFQNTILFLNPGRLATLQFTDEIPRGWILGFSRDFFKSQQLEGLNIKNADIFHGYQELPRIVLSPKIGDRVHSIAEMISELAGSQIPNKEIAISSLLRTMLVYCDSKCNIRPTINSNRQDLNIVSLFKHHVSRNFPNHHQVSWYAQKLNVSPKYLNQVVKRVMGVTAKSVILEQLLIQATRDLKFSNESIKEIAFRLGFQESEHFSNFFKKETGISPSEYRNG